MTSYFFSSYFICTLLNPKTCANFKALCTGEKGVSETTGVRLSYTNTLIHRVVPGGWIQGGNIVDACTKVREWRKSNLWGNI